MSNAASEKDRRRQKVDSAVKQVLRAFRRFIKHQY